jgi:hypothetical protein
LHALPDCRLQWHQHYENTTAPHKMLIENNTTKGKVVPVLSLSTAPLRWIGGMELQLDAFLTSAPDGGEW